MKRRILLAGAASAWPLIATAQPAPGSARVGFIEPGTRDANGPFLASFRAGMAALGWIDGQNLTILDQWLGNQPDRLPGILAGLLADRIDVLVTGGSLVTRLTLARSPDVPIVIVGVADPVGMGFVKSLPRPGGNVTGVANSAVDLVSKRLQLLKEMVPTAKRIAVLTDARDPSGEAYWLQTRDTAVELDWVPQSVPLATAADIDMAIPSLTGRADALLIAFNALMVANRARIATLALAGRLPTSGPLRDFVVAGCLQSLGASLPDEFRRAAPYVDRILRGAKPADLPIEQPTKFELTVNLRTAKALGLAVSPALLMRADEVVE